jgi:hypothetical protein
LPSDLEPIIGRQGLCSGEWGGSGKDCLLLKKSSTEMIGIEEFFDGMLSVSCDLCLSGLADGSDGSDGFTRLADGFSFFPVVIFTSLFGSFSEISVKYCLLLVVSASRFSLDGAGVCLRGSHRCRVQVYSLTILVYWIWVDQTMCVQPVQNTSPESTVLKDTILLYTTTTEER